MMAYVLRYEEELRRADEYFSEIPKVGIDRKQLDLAIELTQHYSAPLNLEEYKDDYENALRKLVEAKRKNLPLPLEEEKPKQPKVIHLMDAIRSSLSQARKPVQRERPARTARGSSGAKRDPCW